MRMEKPQASCPASRRTLRPFVDFVQIECGKQPFFGKVAVRRKVPHRASEKAKKHPGMGAFLLWRKRRDSNSRTVARHRISSAARYDHFDTLPVRELFYNNARGFASV